MNFDMFNLDPRILIAVNAIGFKSPTPIQEQAIPPIMENHDLLGLAQTGTGKTAAFMLPILHRLLTPSPDRRPGQVRALILAPTRELAEQIFQATRTFYRHTNLRAVTIYGGVGKNPQVSGLRKGAEIAIATPGRLLDLLNDRSVDLSRVEVLVLDEADRMCDMGFLPDIRRIIKQLPSQRQTLFFSATMPSDIRTLADEMLRNPMTVQIGELAPASTVSHALYPVPDSLKTDLAFAMLDQVATGRVLIFTRTKHRADRLAHKLEEAGHKVSALQGNMSQNNRQRAIDGFRNGRFDILVATDIAARGIDIAQIGHVINFDMPDTVDAYTHRIGRTGRSHATGEAVTFAAPGDEYMVRQIERVLGEEIERRELADFDYGSYNPLHFSTKRNGQESPRRRPAPQQRSRSVSDRLPARPTHERPVRLHDNRPPSERMHDRDDQPTHARPVSTPHTRPTSDRPSYDRPSNDRPSNDRPSSGRPSNGTASKPRPSGGRPAQPTGSRPFSSRPNSSRPSGSRPNSSRPTGSRPTGARRDNNR